MTEENTTESSDLPRFLLGTKQGMTQVFDEDGSVHPATKVAAGPVVVTQVKTPETDGYAAYQFGFETRDEKNTPQPQQGHMEAAKEAANKEDFFAVLREFRLPGNTSPEANVGDAQAAETFAVGDTVDVSGISKGKGFQGVVKRHGFAGGPRKHGGQKSPERGPGSIGATGDSTVEKGTKMAGRGGGRRTTVQNLEVVHVDTDDNTLYVKGGLPGPDGGLLEITEAKS